MIYSFLRAYLFSDKAHSHTKKMAWISLVAIFSGSFSLVVVLAIMSGLNDATQERLLKNQAHIKVLNFKGSLAEFKQTHLKSQFEEEIKSLHLVEQQDLLIKTEDGYFNGSEAEGLNLEDLKGLSYFYDTKGLAVLEDESSYSNFESVLVGPDLAFELKLVIGDYLEVYLPESLLASQTNLGAFKSKSYKVEGLIQADSGSPEARKIYYQPGDPFFKKSKSRSQGIHLYLHDPAKADELKKSFIGLEVESWKDLNSSLFLALKMEKLAMTFLLGLALVVTSFSIMSLLILLAVQKQKDIGILMSMGFSKLKLRLLFGGIGALLSLIGLASGLVLGSLVALILDYFPLKILPPIYQDPYLPAKFDVSTLLWVLFFCSVVAALSSLVPIHLISKMGPIEALRGQTKL